MTNESPLAKACPHSLDIYFSRNPREMVREDKERSTNNIETIVRELRRQREKWRVEEAQGKTRPTKAHKVAKTTLADLGLED
jgi:hypothetical protein